MRAVNSSVSRFAVKAGAAILLVALAAWGVNSLLFVSNVSPESPVSIAPTKLPENGSEGMQLPEEIGSDAPERAPGMAVADSPDTGGERSGSARGSMTEEQMLKMAEPQFLMNPHLRSALMMGFGPLLSKLSVEEAGIRVGVQLSEAQYAELLDVEAPFNEDLNALGTLYVDDYAQARLDMWVHGIYHFEEPLADGSFRKTLPNESRMKFPGKAIYYSVDELRYPHLAELIKQQNTLLQARRIAVAQVARTYRE